MATYTFWNLDSVQQSRIPEGNVTQNFSTQQGTQHTAHSTAAALADGRWPMAEEAMKHCCSQAQVATVAC
jgi:hypothetical protein